MQVHNLVFVEETENDAVFQCVICGQKIDFNKPGIGEPSAVKTDGGWAAPEGYEVYLDKCKEIEHPSPEIDEYHE